MYSFIVHLIFLSKNIDIGFTLSDKELQCGVEKHGIKSQGTGVLF